MRKLISLRRGDGASILEYVRKCRDQDGWGAQHRRDCSKGTSSTSQNNDSGTDECSLVTKKLELWNVRMEQCRLSCERIYLDVQERIESENPFQVHSCSYGCCGILFGWWCATSPIKERNRLRMRETRVCRYESALVPFGEVVMAKIADADKMRAGNLDSAWVKAVWVGRVDRSNEHLLLTTKGCIRSRVVRRIPDGNRASYHAEVQGLPWDTLKGSAETLRNATVRPGEPPRPSRGRPRKDGRGQRPRQDKKQLVTIPCQAVRMII